MKNIKTILFDLDDTLIVEWNTAKNTFIKTVSYYVNNVDENKFIDIIREEARLIWYELPTIEYALKIGISSWEALWGDFDGENENLKQLKALSADYRLNSWINALAKYGINDPGIALEVSEKFKTLRNKKHILFPDTIPCLDHLKNKYKLGLITNGAPDIQWKKINGGNLKHYFDSIVISGEYGFRKPDTRLFHQALKELKCGVNEAVMVGDKLGTDIKGANQAELRCIWLNRENKVNDFEDIQPDYEIDNLKRIVDIISNI